MPEVKNKPYKVRVKEDGAMEPRWIDGSELLTRLNRKELFEAVKSGKITPYDRDDDCKKIIDYETLLVSNEEKKGVTTWRMPTEKELDEKLSWQDSKPAFLSMDNITSFIYSADEIKAFLKKANPLSEPNVIIRRDVAISYAKKVQQMDPQITLPDAIEKVKSLMRADKFELYHNKHFQRIFKCLDFPPGKSGPKVKK